MVSSRKQVRLDDQSWYPPNSWVASLAMGSYEWAIATHSARSSIDGNVLKCARLHAVLPCFPSDILHICRWISSICFQNLQKLCKLYQESHFVIQRRFLMDGRFLAHRPTKSHFSWPKKHPQSVQEHVANTLEYSEFMSFHIILCYVMLSNVMFSQFAD